MASLRSRRLSKLSTLVGRDLLKTRELGFSSRRAQTLAGLQHHKYKSSVASDPDFTENSIIPAYHFQKSLPRLPIPKLEDTCKRYLKSQRVVLDDDQYASTEKQVELFKNGDGKVLHDQLVAQDKANKHTSYVNGPWTEMYLKDRRPLALTHAPFMSFNDDLRPAYNDQLVRATNFVVASTKFMKTLHAGVLEPEIFHLKPEKSDTESFRKVMRMVPESLAWYAAFLYKAFPLDMSQYFRLFNSTRIPRPEKDELVTDTSAKHLVVMRNGHFFVFDVLDRDGAVVDGKVIMSHLQYILNDQSPPSDSPIGVLTCGDRDSWADLRQKLTPGNEEQMRLIDSAAYVLCLDDIATDDPIEISHTFLHSDGTNRWYDKSFMLILMKNGHACVNFEHAWGDGVAVLRYFNTVFKETTTKAQVHPDTQPAAVDSSAAVKKLQFNVNDEVKAGIKRTKEEFKAKCDSLTYDYLIYNKLGKLFLKEQKISPDSFMQLAFQMAYYRMTGQVVGTYESCSTAAFKHGRTETMRPATSATKAASILFDQVSTRPSVSELRASLEECSKVHGQLTKEAAMGQGFDRHLFALKYLAEHTGQPLPDLYKDPAYTFLNHIILSTSTLSSPAVLIGGFAAVTPNGFGVGYGTMDDQMGLNVSTYSRDVSGFLQVVEQSMDDMHAVLQGRDFKN